jgi:ferredoxin
LSGKKAVISNACTGCGDCVRYCPAGAIVLVQSSGGTVTLKQEEIEKIAAAA